MWINNKGQLGKIHKTDLISIFNNGKILHNYNCIYTKPGSKIWLAVIIEWNARLHYPDPFKPMKDEEKTSLSVHLNAYIRKYPLE